MRADVRNTAWILASRASLTLFEAGDDPDAGVELACVTSFCLAFLQEAAEGKDSTQKQCNLNKDYGIVTIVTRVVSIAGERRAACNKNPFWHAQYSCH